MTKRYRASKNVTKTLSEVQKLEKQIEDIKNGKVTSRSAVINEKNLKNLELNSYATKKLEITNSSLFFIPSSVIFNLPSLSL